MLRRSARVWFVSLLLVSGVAAAAIGADIWLQSMRAAAAERSALTRIDAMLAAVNELAVTQRGYFERGGQAVAAERFDRVRQLSDALSVHLEALRAEVKSADASGHLSSLVTALDAFTSSDSRARTNLASDTFVSAADLVFSASAAELRAVTGSLLGLRDVVTTDAAAIADSLRMRAAITAGALGAMWAIGILLLAQQPPAQEAEESHAPASAGALADPQVPPVESPAIATTPTPPATSARVVDFVEVARVCGAMATAGSAAELREVLAEAAAAVHATGMIVWLGAGEELFPVLGHGYDPQMLPRLGPLARQAENATAIAWRTIEPQHVQGSQGRTGAVVLPILGADACIGVLSTEVPSGLENDADVGAATRLFAAQLSTVVAAWPAASEVASDPPDEGPVAVTL